jgi:hypothetical protein
LVILRSATSDGQFHAALGHLVVQFLLRLVPFGVGNLLRLLWFAFARREDGKADFDHENRAKAIEVHAAHGTTAFVVEDFDPHRFVPPDAVLKRLPEEAEDLRTILGGELSARGIAFLDRLISLRANG